MQESIWILMLMFLLPAALVLVVVYIILKKFFDHEERRRFYELRASNQKTALPIRLQAFERLALLMERISPNHLIMRVKKAGMDAQDLQAALLAEVRAEFDHNLSQQIYVTAETWAYIVAAKENIIRIVNSSAAILPASATGLDLSKQIFEVSMRDENPPSQKALAQLKKEAQQLF